MGRTLTSSEIRAYLTDSAAKRHPAAAGEWGTSGTRSLLRDGLIGYWLLAQGEPKFGARVIENKRDLVLANIENTLAALPKRELDPALGLYVYAITKTPFLGAYDFDDVELRAYFLLHGLQDRRAIDVADVER